MPASETFSFNTKPGILETLRALLFTFRVLWSIEARLLIFSFFLNVIQAPIAGLGVFAIARLTDALSRAQFQEAMVWATWFVASRFVSSVFLVLSEEWVEIGLRAKIEVGFRERMMRHMASLPYATLEDPEFRTLAHAAEEKHHIVPVMVDRGMWIFFQAFTVLGSASVFFIVPWPVTVVTIVTIIIRLVASNVETHATWNVFTNETRDGRRALYRQRMLTEPTSALALKSLGLDISFLHSWSSISHRLVAERLRVGRRNVFAYSLANVLFTAGLGCGLWIMLRDVQRGAVTLGALVAFLSTFPRIWDMMDRVLWNVRSVLRDLPYLSLVRRFFETKSERDFGKSVTKNSLIIHFEDVWFRYPGAKTDVIKGVNFSFSEGDDIAIVGLNGAGKSTLLKLLMGTYIPTRGRITVNGVDLQRIRPVAWRRSLAVMAQDQIRFDDTVSEQVRYGDYSSKTNRPRFILALKTSGLKQVAQAFPYGLRTHAGRAYAAPEDQPIELSGGQVQIIALARTVYRNARIYIFDEPTSAVDAEKEERFFEALPAALEGRAVLFVSHRFSTLRRAKRILVIDDGRIIEDGTHEDLLYKHGRYAELFTLQAKMYQ